MDEHRDGNGRFLDGCPPGPGRPPRATERAYLVELAEAIPLPTWRRIVEKAAKDAEAGDAKARDWIAKYLVGSGTKETPTLHSIAVAETSGEDISQEIEREAAERNDNRSIIDRLLADVDRDLGRPPRSRRAEATE